MHVNTSLHNTIQYRKLIYVFDNISCVAIILAVCQMMGKRRETQSLHLHTSYNFQKQRMNLLENLSHPVIAPD